MHSNFFVSRFPRFVPVLLAKMRIHFSYFSSLVIKYGTALQWTNTATPLSTVLAQIGLSSRIAVTLG
jgi:hypothetical protein